MEGEIKKIINHFDNQISNINQIRDIPLSEILLGIEYCENCIFKLKDLVVNGQFKTQKSEIEFFKNTKPNVYGFLKFLLTLHQFKAGQFETKPNKAIKNINRKLDSFRKRFKQYENLVSYCIQDKNELDVYYFTRGQPKMILKDDSLSFFTEPKFTTNLDIFKAQIIAFNLIKNNLEFSSFRSSQETITNHLKWSNSKTDLVELIYALKASNAIMNGKTDIKVIASFCETMFNVSLGNYYKTYSEIKSRKFNKTTFIDTLKISLENKILEDDMLV